MNDKGVNEQITHSNEDEQNSLLKDNQDLKGIQIISSGELSEKETDGKLSINPAMSPTKSPGHIQRHNFSKKTLLTRSTILAKKTKSLIVRRRWVPAIDWARNYNLSSLTGDLIAGVTTALTVIPQGIGYAPLAGLPLQYGLYGSIVPGFMYALLGTCKETTIGPTAPNALLSFNYAGHSVVHAVTLAFIAGIIEIAAGILNLGFMVNFISAPVISAFTSAVAIQVVTSQIKGLLGLQIPGRGFVNTWVGVFKNVNKIRPCDAALGFSSIGILLFLRKLKDFHWFEGSDSESTRAKVIQKIKWVISIARNCLIVVISSAIAYVLVEVWQIDDSLILTGDVTPGLPPFQLPWQSREAEWIPVNGTVVHNPDANKFFDPLEIMSDLGMGLILLPLVSIMPQVAMAQFYAEPGKSVDTSQEIFALGSSQLLGSFIGSIAVTASVGRCAVNAASGVCTPFGGIITGLIIIAACAFLTPYFAYIPTTAVAAVIIAAMIFTLEIEILLPIWKSKKIDLVPYAMTLGVGVFVSVEMGMISGTLVHLAILLYSSNTPKIRINKIKGEIAEYFLVEPDRALFFPSVDNIRTALATKTSPRAPKKASKAELNTEDKTVDCEAAGQLNEIASNVGQDEPLPVIIDLSRVVDVDFTAAVGIRALAKSMKKSGQVVYFCGASEKVEAILQGADPSLFLSYGNVEEAENRLAGS